MPQSWKPLSECRATETLIYCWRECKMTQPFLMTVWQLSNRLNTLLPYNVEITLLDIDPRELKTHVYTKTSTWMFMLMCLVTLGRRKWQPTPVFLPGESGGQRSWKAAVHRVAQSRTQLKRLSMRALEKEMVTHSSIFPWRIPGTEEPGGLRSMGLQSRTRLKRLSSRGSLVTQSCPTLCDPMDCSLPGFSVHGIPR